jgi:hypothetical protein
VSLELYSKKAHEVVGRIEMKYAGSSVDEAIRKFAEKYRAEFPGLSCAGWTWK